MLLGSTEMASLQVSRCAVCSFSVLDSGLRRKPSLCRSESSRWRVPVGRWGRVRCLAQEGDKDSNGEEPPESLFMKELRRRSMTPTSQLEDTKRSLNDVSEAEIKVQNESSSFSKRKGVISTEAGNNPYNQRDRSMALNSEGLEGLIPRAKLLLTLGGTFFLGFSSLILVTVAFFTALYFYLGPAFVHDASNTSISPPTYVDPYMVLEEERLSQSAPQVR